MLNDKSDVGHPQSSDAAGRSTPPRWATGLRRVLYPDVATDEDEEDISENSGDSSSGS
jgi:hypothetical protein